MDFLLQINWRGEKREWGGGKEEEEEEGMGMQPHSENEAADEKKLQRSDLTLRWRRYKRTGI